MNADAITECLNNFDIGKHGVQNFLEKVFSDIDVLDVYLARKEFAADVLATEVLKQHREVLVEDGRNKLGHLDAGNMS